MAGSANGEPGYQDGVGSEALFSFDAAKAEPAEDWKKGSVCEEMTEAVYVGDRVNYCVRKIIAIIELSRLWQDWPEIKVALTEQEYRHALTDFTEWIAMRKEI